MPNNRQTKIFGLSTTSVTIIGGLCLCVGLTALWTRPSTTGSQPVATATEELRPKEISPTGTYLSPTRTSRPTQTPKVVSSPTEEGELGAVVRILDGDTIEVDLNGITQRVHYIGISTPDKGQLCFTEATQANVGLVYQQTVRLVKDRSETDAYNRLLRYVYVGETFVNAVLVRQGWAEAIAFPPDTAQAVYFEYLETEARNAGRGCHPLGVFNGAVVAAQPTTASSLPTETPVPPAQPTETPLIIAAPANIGYACANGQACIKGNINGEGEHIYHYPGCDSYEATRINESAGERWFTTGAEAEAAGWRMARNCH